MKRLSHEQAGRSESAREIANPRWSRYLVAGGALALFGLGGCATTQANVTPATGPAPTVRPQASAAPTQQILINGLGFLPFDISDTVASLQARSQQYQRGERIDNGIYSNRVEVRTPRLDGVVTISQNGGENTFGVSYFKGGERQYWEIEISDFTNIVNQLSGRQVDRMRMIVDDGVPSSRGDQMISVIALPLDSSGNLIGQYNGVQLGLCGQYFPERDRANGARVMLQPPAPPNQIAEGDIPGRTYATSRR